MTSRLFRRSAGAILLASMFAPAFAGAQQTPEAILKQAVSRVTRTRNYAVHMSMESSEGKDRTTSVQADYHRAGRKERTVFRAIHSDFLLVGDLPDNATVTAVSDGRKEYLSCAGEVRENGRRQEPSYFLPDVSDLGGYDMSLLPPQTLDGLTVLPVRMALGDRFERTCFIEPKTHRLVQILIEDRMEGTPTQTKIVFSDEVLNPKLPPEEFRIPRPKKMKSPVCYVDSINPFTVAVTAWYLSRPQ